MTGRRGASLPPAMMQDVELDRVIVGDGSGGCACLPACPPARLPACRPACPPACLPAQEPTVAAPCGQMRAYPGQRSISCTAACPCCLP